MWAGQKGLKALKAVLKKNEIKFIKMIQNKKQIHNTTNWQTRIVGQQGSYKIPMNFKNIG